MNDYEDGYSPQRAISEAYLHRWNLRYYAGTVKARHDNREMCGLLEKADYWRLDTKTRASVEKQVEGYTAELIRIQNENNVLYREYHRRGLPRPAGPMGDEKDLKYLTGELRCNLGDAPGDAEGVLREAIDYNMRLCRLIGRR